MTSGPAEVGLTDRLPPGTLMKLPEGVLALAPVLNAILSDVPLSLAPIAVTANTVATSASGATSAISFDFLDIEASLVEGLPSCRLGPDDSNGGRPPFRRGATLWAQ